MSWRPFKSDNASPKQPTIAAKGKKSRLRRIAKTLGFTALGVFVFGLLVSLYGVDVIQPRALASAAQDSLTVREVTQLYPIRMQRVAVPRSVEEIAELVKLSPGPLSIGGGRYSMGGQTATPDGIQFDMRPFHGIVAFDHANKTVTVRAGTTWRELQQFLDTAGLAVKIMQTYNTFTVGGALSVNAHGRYIGQGPLVRSVRAIQIVLADGSIVNATRDSHADIFYGAIGGYGALGIITNVTLDVAENTRVRRDDIVLPLSEYRAYFKQHVRDDSTVVFHNADIYPPSYTRVHAVTYRNTQLPVTDTLHIRPVGQASRMHRAALSLMMDWPGGKWIRQHAIDPYLFRDNPVTWRNYEASYDVSELDPGSRDRETYVLQEYFVPVDSLPTFVPKMQQVLNSHHVNVLNVSIRHALPDSGTLLSWAPNEVYAYVLYYKQNTDPKARSEVGRWTRELIDAAESSGGRYYLPYQPLATRAQFMRGYPRADSLFALKRRYDPTNKFTNTLWDTYIAGPGGVTQSATAAHMPAVLPAEARIVLDTLRDYAREEGNAYLTHPEWDLVYSSEAYASWLEANRRPSGFPYVASVGTFWRSYRDSWRATRVRYPVSMGTHVMLCVIGISTAVEYGLKGGYENTIGRLSEMAMPDSGTAEDHYAAKVARDYAKFIATRGWYEFGFAQALRGLWREVPMTGPGFVRKWERRGALSTEYTIKAVYATIVGLGTKAGYDPDALTRSIVVAGWSDSLRTDSALKDVKVSATLDRGYVVLEMPRYDAYRETLRALARHYKTVRVAEVSGCDVVTLTGLADSKWHAPEFSTVVTAYAAPSDLTQTRVLLSVHARDLLYVLSKLDTGGAFLVDHIYDY